MEAKEEIVQRECFQELCQEPVEDPHQKPFAEPRVEPFSRPCAEPFSRPFGEPFAKPLTDAEALPDLLFDSPDDDSQDGSRDGSQDGCEEEVKEEHQKPEILFDDITFDALLYSHVVLNCGRHEVHAPVLSTLMLMAVIGMSPATFFVGVGLGLPVFWLAQRCLNR